MKKLKVKDGRIEFKKTCKCGRKLKASYEDISEGVFEMTCLCGERYVRLIERN